jgi:hypothetical protein
MGLGGLRMQNGLDRLFVALLSLILVGVSFVYRNINMKSHNRQLKFLLQKFAMSILVVGGLAGCAQKVVIRDDIQEAISAARLSKDKGEALKAFQLDPSGPPFEYQKIWPDVSVSSYMRRCGCYDAANKQTGIQWMDSLSPGLVVGSIATPFLIGSGFRSSNAGELAVEIGTAGLAVATVFYWFGWGRDTNRKNNLELFNHCLYGLK